MDYYGALIRMALGESITLSPSQLSARSCMAKLLFSKKEGILTDIDTAGLKALTADGTQISLDYSAGATVPAVQNGTSRIGQVIAITDSIDQMNILMSNVRRKLKINGVDLETLWNS